jgi:hypothetical protein
MPLERSSRGVSGNFNLGLDANVGDWQLNFLGTLEFNNRRILTDRQLGSRLTLLDSAARNPFIDPAASFFELGRQRSVSVTRNASALITASRQLLKLPAGPLRLTLSGSYDTYEISDRRRLENDLVSERFEQRDVTGSVAFDVPLASRSKGFLPFLGELTANVEWARSDVSRLGTLARQSYSVRWTPLDWLRIAASASESRTPPNRSFLSEPVLVTPDVRYFDPVRGETVDVVEISGGVPNLSPQRSASRRLGVTIAPKTGMNLRLHGEYSVLKNSNFLASLPPASRSVITAFPDRFVRDEQGLLTRVDVRPVAFDSRSQDQLRYGFSFAVPLSGGGSRRRSEQDRSPETQASDGTERQDEDEEQSAPATSREGGRTRLQVTGTHTMLLRNEIIIAAGLPSIDLLSRNAIGIGGSSGSKHQVDVSLGLSTRGAGVRLTGRWRSVSFLNLAGAQEFLRFAPSATFNLRAFTEARKIFPTARWLQGARLSVSLLNVTNERQSVRDAVGSTPLRYQAGYRDPIGRTFELEFRKAF